MPLLSNVSITPLQLYSPESVYSVGFLPVPSTSFLMPIEMESPPTLPARRWLSKYFGNPEEVGELKKLQTFDLFGDKFINEIPNSLGQVMNLGSI
ncbi:hypothetical protein L2E82_42503 [Cichorium intybus]|uniref:Uncharacterized protein n=1 Tax=Cichorium intybus TaxID=13427 RepID=A0ACB8ZM62_CICIN|nr:hypothetical protein L2E82_42503 [Cichorium intybus]